jgi:DNA-binding transcriptional LysR family regulator
MSLTLDQLRVLDAIERHGSFAAAGQALHRTTSAISYGVRTLEEALGLTLFDRDGHRAELTPAGRLVLESGRRLLDEAADLEGLARALQNDWEPTLLVVADGIFPMRPLMRAMRRLTQEGVPTRLSLRVEYLGGVRERFDEQSADLMLTLAFAGDARHAATPLAPIEMVLVARAKHPVLEAPRLDRAALAQHVELVVEDSSRHSEARTRPLSLGSAQVFRLSDFHSKREALLEGVGIGWMPLHLVDDLLRRGRLVELPLGKASRHVFVPHLVHRRGTPPGRAARRFVELLGQELPETKPGPRARRR